MNLFSHVKRQLSILEVINEYTVLKKAGLYWKGCCPFHNEKTASFTVSPHKEIFYCFGCHSGGDVIAFVAKAENCTPIEAAKLLIERRQLTVPDTLIHEVSSHTSQARNRYFDLCKIVAEWAHEQIPKYHIAMDYIQKRAMSKASVDYFTIGYFPGGPQAIRSLLAYAQGHHFLPDDLIQANIIAQGKTVLYSPFEERIIFPIKDHLGRCCGFGGRIFKPHDERAKYYNSRENSYFTKGSLLFGLDKAKQAIQKTEKVFLVEGYTDCVAMVQYGYPNTVATLGTACTLEHLTTLSRYAQELYVLYDGDHAGQEAILRLTQLCWQVNMELNVICLPVQDDPASFLSKKHDLKALIDEAMDIFVFFIFTLGKDFAFKKLSEKLQLTNKIISLLEKIDDPIKRDLLIQKASKTLDIPFKSLQEALGKANRPRHQIKQKESPAPLSSQEEASLPPLEKKLFFAIMYNIQLLNRDNEEYLIEYLPQPMSTILKKLILAKNTHSSLDFTQFFDMLDSSEQHFVSKILLECANDGSDKDFEQLLLHLHKKHWKLIVHTTKLKLAQAEHSGEKEKIEKILNDFLALKNKMLNKNLV